MSKKEQAARIAENHYGEYVADYQEYRKRLARSIRRAITAAVRKERERCIAIIAKIQLDKTTSTDAFIKLNDAFILIDRPNNTKKRTNGKA